MGDQSKQAAASTHHSTVVIKVGTSSLVRTELNSLNLSNVARICETVRDLHNAGHRVVVVSSGAVGVGALRFRLASRPKEIAQKQALAAVGQVHLMRFYDDFFSALGLTCAQVLLTLDNLANRGQYLNASNTFQELFAYGTIPIVNENDTVAVEEIRFGDNDTLSAQVATLVRADWLFLLTDVDALYTANPNTDPNAQPIPEVHDLEQLQVDTSTAGTQWGTGGMSTKLTAARIATAAGCKLVICNAATPESIARVVLHGERVGTLFHAHPRANKGRKRWIPSVPVKGALWLDAGAVRAVRECGTSLFSAGVVRATGDFCAQDAVRICDANGCELARGICNYSCPEVLKIKGKSSKDFKEQLGYVGAEEIVHRDNISLLTLRRQSSTSPAPGGSPPQGLSGSASDAELSERPSRARREPSVPPQGSTHGSPGTLEGSQGDCASAVPLEGSGGTLQGAVPLEGSGGTLRGSAPGDPDASRGATGTALPGPDPHDVSARLVLINQREAAEAARDGDGETARPAAPSVKRAASIPPRDVEARLALLMARDACDLEEACGRRQPLNFRRPGVGESWQAQMARAIEEERASEAEAAALLEADPASDVYI